MQVHKILVRKNTFREISTGNKTFLVYSTKDENYPILPGDSLVIHYKNKDECYRKAGFMQSRVLPSGKFEQIISLVRLNLIERIQLIDLIS